MTRDEVLAEYRPIRAGIQRILKLAPTACRPADMRRAVKQVAPWAEEEDLQSDDAVNMLVDVALFEPNQRGRRAFDRFLVEKAGQLDPADLALAERMAAAWFSIFRVAGRHEAAGLWLEDRLDRDRRLWLADEGLEASAPDGLILAMRVFDAGPFHAGFGIIVQPDEATIGFCLDARARGAGLPFRHSLAATLYGDHLRDVTPPGPADLALLATLFETLVSPPDAPRTSEDQLSRPPKRRQPRRSNK